MIFLGEKSMEKVIVKAGKFDIQTIITCLNIMYPGKFIDITVHFSSHTTPSGKNKDMDVVWELFVADNYCKEFSSVKELFTFIKLEYFTRKLANEYKSI